MFIIKRTKFLIFLYILYFLLINSVIPDTLSNFPAEEDYKVAVDKAPKPIAGFESLIKKIVYPTMALQTHTEGKVYLLVYLNENGDVDDVKVVKGIGGGCDEEAEYAVKKAKFTIATQNGIPVKSKFAIALNFKIP